MDFLAAILAAPDDLALREVWADALQREGDPRGELIAIQLAAHAGRETRDGWARAQELVEAHGATWAGTLAQAFAAHVYEAGMFAGGRLFAADLDVIVEDPAWPFVTTLSDSYREEQLALVDHPRSRIARLVATDFDQIEQWLARGGRGDALVELGTSSGTDRIATLDPAKLPNVRTFAARVDGPPGDFATAALLEQLACVRLERIGFYDWRRAVPLVAELANRAGALRTIELALEERRRDLGWRVRLVRDAAPGPFTRIVAWHRGGRAPKDLSQDCRKILNLVAADAVREVEIDVGRAVRMPPDAVGELVAQLDGMPALEHAAVPWPFANTRAAARETAWSCDFHATKLFDSIDRVWSVFADDLGIVFDCLTVNERGTPALGKKPVDTLRTRAGQPKTTSLAIRRKGHAHHVTLHRSKWSPMQRLEATVSHARSLDDTVAWFLRALVLAPDSFASLRLASTDYPYRSFDTEGYLGVYETPGWLVALPPRCARALATAKLPARSVPSPTGHLVLVLGANPADATPERTREVAAAVVAALDDWAAPRAPTWFAAVVEEVLGPPAVAGGLTLARSHPMRVEWRQGRTSLVARLHGAFDETMTCSAYVEGQSSGSIGRLNDCPLERDAVADALRKGLGDLANHLR